MKKEMATVQIPKTIRAELKRLSADTDMSIQALCEIAIIKYLSRVVK